MHVGWSVAHAPLRVHEYRLLLLARTLVAAGNWMMLVAASALVFQSSGSAMSVGVLAVLAVAPRIPGGALGGLWVHRHCPRKTSAVLFAVEAVPVGVLAFMAATGRATVPVIFALTLIAAIPAGIATSVSDDLLKLTVPEPQRSAAGAIERVFVNLARVVGAVAGGAVVLDLGYATAFAINAGALVLFTVLVYWAKSLQPACDRLQSQERAPIAHAVRHYRERGVVRVVIVSSAIFFLIVAPLDRQMPSIAAHHGDSAMYVGLLVAALALGAAIASPVIFTFDGSHYRHPILGVALCATGPLLILLSVSMSFALDLLLLLLIGVCAELVRKSAEFSLEREVPVGARTLAGAFVISLVATGLCVGAIVVGAAFDDLGLGPSLAIFGAVVLVCGLTFMWRDRVRAELPAVRR